MICKRCGTKFSDGMFCPECGTRIVEVSDVGGENLLNTWEDALEYSEGEEYNTKMYGPHGQLEEIRITKDIEVSAGGKEVFENKILVFEERYECIKVKDNTKLEFYNCTFNLSEGTAIDVQGTNVSMVFENCLIKGNGPLIEGYKSSYANKDGAKLEFRNCAFINDRPKEEYDAYFAASEINILKIYGSTYFENCFFNVTRLGLFEGRYYDGVVPNLEFRNCVIIGKAANIVEEKIGASAIIIAGNEILIDFDSCYIRSLERLVCMNWGSEDLVKIRYKNSYLNDYSYIRCKI